MNKCLADIPCMKCDKQDECMSKIHKCNKLWEIYDMMFCSGEIEFNNCPIHIAIVAPDMVEED